MDENGKDNVIQFPDLGHIDMGPPVAPTEVLEYASKLGLKSVIIVGLKPCGCLYLASSEGEIDANIGRLERAKFLLNTIMAPHDGDHPEEDGDLDDLEPA